MIRVESLCKSFGKLKVLENVSLNVEEGEKIAIIGGSGCGKSVFLRSLELLEIPDSGHIYIDNDEITAKNADINTIRRKMGMVYQNFNLFSHMNVMDNMCLAPVKLLKIPRKQAEEQAMELLNIVSLTSKAKDWPSYLSGGQKQRIAIARSLMMKPKVMLFDEPTSALDPTMVGEVLATIRVLAKQGLTMLVVTHEMAFARELSDRVLFFADKGIYEQGKPKELFDKPKGKKTIAFINKLKFFYEHISNRNFDLMQLHGKIRNFAEKYALGEKVSNRLQLCSEEIIYELLDNCCEDPDKVDLNIGIEYFESEKNLLLNCDCFGKNYNPFQTDNEDFSHLGITIIKNTAKNYNCKYENGKIMISAQL